MSYCVNEAYATPWPEKWPTVCRE